jgi:hypothetical protein
LTTNFFSSLAMFDAIINLFLPAVYSVICSEHAAVAVVPTALLGVGAVVSLVTGNTIRFHPRPTNNNGGKLFWFFTGIAFCIFLRWPVTSILTIILGVVQAYLGWIPSSGPSWKILVQATMTWILAAIVAHHTTKAFQHGYQKVIRTIGAAVMSLAVGVVRIIYSTVTWLFRLVTGRLYPSRFGRGRGNKSTAEEGEVEYEVDHEVAATSVHQVNYNMEDYVYDSDYDHEGDDEGGDIEYDSNHYEPDDDSLTAPTNKAEESSLEDGHLDESPLMQARLLFEEVPENDTSHASTYDLMSDQASILRCSPRVRGKPSPCYTKGKIDYSMRYN